MAKEYGYNSFEYFDDISTFGYRHHTPEIIDEIAKRYAEEAIRECAERAEIEYSPDVVYNGPYLSSVDKQSILSLINELK